MNISEIRKTYPQYNDLSDIQLADKFHSKYYSDIPKDTFYAKMGIKQKSLWERGVEATGAESDMMSSPANAEILRTAVGGGAAWIPAGVIKAAGIVSGQREGADELANVIQEKITGTPQTPEGKLAAQQISAPFEKLSEKSQEYADIVYDKTGSPLLATATRVAGEAIPFVAPVAVGKGLKAVKGAVKAPEIDLGKVSEKPTSITPDVSAELKALKGEENATQKGKVEVGNISEHKGADEVGAQAETGSGNSVKSIPKTEEKVAPQDTATQFKDEIIDGTDNNNVKVKFRVISSEPIQGNPSLDTLIDFAKQQGLKPAESDAFFMLVRGKEVFRPFNEFVGKDFKGTKGINADRIKEAYTAFKNKTQEGQSKGQIHLDVEKDLQYVSKPAVPIRTLDELRDFDRAVSYLSSENKKTVGDIYKEYGFNVDINKGKVSGYDFVGTEDVYLKQKKIVEDAQELFKSKYTSTAEKVALTQSSQAEKVAKPIETVKTEIPIEGKPAKAALDINKDLIEKGFEGLPERELARYSTIQKVEEVGKAQALVSNPDFFEMAKGNKPMPEDVHPQVLFNVAINEATKAGNIDMLMDLAKSPIAEQRSLAAQQLGASAWEKPVNNIVKTINEVKKVRESKIKNPKVKEVVKTKLREEVSKINLSKEELNWEKFLSKIEC